MGNLVHWFVFIAVLLGALGVITFRIGDKPGDAVNGWNITTLLLWGFSAILVELAGILAIVKVVVG